MNVIIVISLKLVTVIHSHSKSSWGKNEEKKICTRCCPRPGLRNALKFAFLLSQSSGWGVCELLIFKLVKLKCLAIEFKSVQ